MIRTRTRTAQWQTRPKILRSSWTMSLQTTKKSKLQKQSSQINQIHQLRGCGGGVNGGSSGNIGRGWSNLLQGSKNRTITASQAFVRECEEPIRVIFGTGDSYRADCFDAAIKQIANCVGTNFDDGSSIRYIVLKLKSL